MDVKRRTFMKALGLTAAGTLLPGCEKDVRHLVPYVLPDDEIVPGQSNWYASTCGECGAGCGVIVRVMEGRAKKIEGNPEHPLNQGKLCAQGQAALQRLYNPDRLHGPLHRIGFGAEQRLAPTSWNQGIQELGQRLRRAKGRVTMISRPLSGTLAELLSTFIRSLGGELYFYDPAGELPLRAAARRLYGIPEIPQHDLAETDFLLSFGAPLLEPWLSPVSFGLAYSHMRQGRKHRRGRFVQIEPRLSLTAANADQWIPIKPGTEGLLAMGIAHLLLKEGRSRLPQSQLGPYETFYGTVGPDTVAMECDIPLSQIRDLARAFADADSSLAMAGGPACAHTNAFETQVAIEGLNALVDNINRPGGIRWYATAPIATDLNVPWLSERHAGDLARASEGGRPSVLLLYDCNPLFTIPPSVPVRELFENSSFIASFSGSLDESSAMADLILPDHCRLETWGDHVQGGSCPRQTATLIQPVVAPLYDTRALGDTILELTRLLRPHESASNFSQLLEQRWRTFLQAQSPPVDGRPPSNWETQVQLGGWWSSKAVERKLKLSLPRVSYEPAAFDGETDKFPFFFYPYPSTTLGHGRSADIPWLQELPDTMTSALWGSWIEINPSTAKAMDIQQGDLVRLHSRHGSLEAAALLYPGLRPDVIAMPLGQGHTNYGRYANHRGANPLSILAALFDKESGALASGATRIRLEPLKVPGKLIRLEQPGIQTGSELLSIERIVRRPPHG